MTDRTPLLQSGFAFEVTVTVRGLTTPVVVRGSFPDAAFVHTEALSPELAQKVTQALNMAYNEARLSLALRTPP